MIYAKRCGAYLKKKLNPQNINISLRCHGAYEYWEWEKKPVSRWLGNDRCFFFPFHFYTHDIKKKIGSFVLHALPSRLNSNFKNIRVLVGRWKTVFAKQWTVQMNVKTLQLIVFGEFLPCIFFFQLPFLKAKHVQYKNNLYILHEFAHSSTVDKGEIMREEHFNCCWVERGRKKKTLLTEK